VANRIENNALIYWDGVLLKWKGMRRRGIEPDHITLKSFIMDRASRQSGFRWKFTQMEDIRLAHIVARCGSGNWSFVASQMPGRNPRQCRERWANYINPELNHQPLSPAEDMLLESKYEEIGPRWQQIASFLPRRSKNLLKNHWMSRRRRSEQEDDCDLKSSIIRSNDADTTAERRHTDDPDNGQACPDAHPGCLSIFDIEFEREEKDSSYWIFAAAGFF
jgi:hypothetical protein